MIRQPDVDRQALAEYTTGVRRSVAEYAAVPQTHHTPIAGPCIRDCGRTAYTQRGVCRECLRTQGDK